MAAQANMETENTESEFSHVVSKVILPNGGIKTSHQLNSNNLIREEKENILREAEIPYPNLYVMVMLGPMGSYQVLDDTLSVDAYMRTLARGAEVEIEIKKRSSEAERPAKAVKPELFNIRMK